MPSAPSHFTRRRILCWTGVGAIGGLAGYLGWPNRGTVSPQDVKPSVTGATASEAQTTPTAPSTASAPAGPMSREAFLSHLGSTFQLDSGTSSKLLKVSEAQQTASKTATFVSFSLLFSAPAGSPSESRIYQVTHAKMGEMELFISPVGRSKELVHLEAIISQRV